MVHAYPPESEILDEWAAFLKGTHCNEYSQFGEDGLLAALFARIGIQNRWCFELGASDGLMYSNTKALRDQDWSAVLIEKNQTLFAKLENVTKGEPGTRIVGCEVSGDTTIDELLEYADAPYDMDLGVIDVDGQDYWLWHDMKLFAPRVMLVEYALRNLSSPTPERGSSGQAGRGSIAELGVNKGYRPVAATPCNLLFVREDVRRDANK